VLSSFGGERACLTVHQCPVPGILFTRRAIAELPVWAREQEALKSLSPLSWRVIARGSGHGVQHGRLDVVVAEMTHLIGFLRGGPAPPFGSTVTE